MFAETWQGADDIISHWQESGKPFGAMSKIIFSNGSAVTGVRDYDKDTTDSLASLIRVTFGMMKEGSPEEFGPRIDSFLLNYEIPEA